MRAMGRKPPIPPASDPSEDEPLVMGEGGESTAWGSGRGQNRARGWWEPA